jgi:hypothetical protein
MIKWKNIRDRFSHDDRDLQLKLLGGTGQPQKRLYMKGR